MKSIFPEGLIALLFALLGGCLFPVSSQAQQTKYTPIELGYYTSKFLKCSSGSLSFSVVSYHYLPGDTASYPLTGKSNLYYAPQGVYYEDDNKIYIRIRESLLLVDKYRNSPSICFSDSVKFCDVTFGHGAVDVFSVIVYLDTAFPQHKSVSGYQAEQLFKIPVSNSRIKGDSIYVYINSGVISSIGLIQSAKGQKFVVPSEDVIYIQSNECSNFRFEKYSGIRDSLLSDSAIKLKLNQSIQMSVVVRNRVCFNPQEHILLSANEIRAKCRLQPQQKLHCIYAIGIIP